MASLSARLLSSAMVYLALRVYNCPTARHEAADESPLSHSWAESCRGRTAAMRQNAFDTKNTFGLYVLS